MIKKRTTKITVYLGLIVLLGLFIGYSSGYRLSSAQLIKDLDSSLHFSPSVIVHEQVFSDRAVIISQHDDWLVCRSVKSTLGILWHDANLSMTPINLNDQLEDKSYSQVVAEYAEACNGLGNQTLVLDQVYRKLDTNRDTFIHQSALQGLTILEQGRQTVIRNKQVVIDQQFGNDQFTVHFYSTKYGEPVAIELMVQTDLVNAQAIQQVFKTITSNTLSGWTFSSKIIASSLEEVSSDTVWAETRGSIKVECLIPNLHFVFSKLN